MQFRSYVALSVLMVGSLPCFAGSSCKVNVVFAHSPKAAGDFARLLEKAEAGDSAAEFQAGLAYETGTATDQDFSTAVKRYQRAADRGNANAQNNLGGMYLRGLGVDQSDREAVRWYRKATAHGYAPAEYKLGLLYYQGEAVAQDVGEALRWFHKAAEHGSAAAENEIGNAYEHGQGVRQDFDEAERWYRIAAEHGLAEARLNVEVMRTVRAGSTPRIAAAREQGSFTTEGPANVVPGGNPFY